MIQYLSKELTHELLSIVDEQSWEELEELLAVYGYDESEVEGAIYKDIEVTYTSRQFVGHTE